MAKKADFIEGEVQVISVKRFQYHIKGTGMIIFNRPNDMNISAAEKQDQKKEDPLLRERRVWREKLYVNHEGEIVLPGNNFHQGLMDATRYWGMKIAGAGQKTYTNLVKAGVICSELHFGVAADAESVIGFGANVNGNPSAIGGGKKVWRIRPALAPGWTATGEITVLDGRLTKDVMKTILTFYSVFVGLGDWRPQQGRFELISIEEV